MPSTRVTIFLAVLTAAIVAAPIAGGQERRIDTPDPRYGMTEVEDGYLRLDRETGEVSHCRRIGENWSCTVTPDERRDLENELTALREERQTLRRENEQLRAALRDVALRADRAARAADAVAGDGGDATPERGEQSDIARRPRQGERGGDDDGDFTDEAKRDIDRALDVTSYAVRRLFETFQDIENELSTR